MDVIWCFSFRENLGFIAFQSKFVLDPLQYLVTLHLSSIRINFAVKSSEPSVAAPVVLSQQTLTACQ